jgi:hypothetical protein
MQETFHKNAVEDVEHLLSSCAVTEPGLNQEEKVITCNPVFPAGGVLYGLQELRE